MINDARPRGILLRDEDVELLVIRETDADALTLRSSEIVLQEGEVTLGGRVTKSTMVLQYNEVFLPDRRTVTVETQIHTVAMPVPTYVRDPDGTDE